jgi:hypothetical protein
MMEIQKGQQPPNSEYSSCRRKTEFEEIKRFLAGGQEVFIWNLERQE